MRRCAYLLSLALLACELAAFGQVQESSNLYKSSRDNVTAVDPFDVGTGIYFREYLDLYVKDTIPIEFVRTQRNMDSRSRSFGIGGSTSYDMFIVGDVAKFSWVALILANGTQERYTRISPGTTFADGVFENKTSPDRFFGSRIAWNQHGGWTVTLRGGTEYTVQGCGAQSRPGQCAVIEIKSSNGDRLTVTRDRAGNIQRITSPHGHTVTIESDSEGRITKAVDDARHWVSYGYDERGALRKSTNWRRESDEFRYDEQFNMTFVREKSPASAKRPACTVTVSNRFDEKNRFAGQTVSNGEFASVKYTTAPNGDIREVNVKSQDGLTHYFFNDAGYETREDFRGGTNVQWSLQRVRDADTNAVLELRLACKTQEVRLPLELEHSIEQSESYIPYFSRFCRQMAKHKPEPKKISESAASGQGQVR